MLEIPVIDNEPPRTKKPDWLKVKLPTGQNYLNVRKLVDEYKPVSYTHLTLPTNREV